MIKQATSPAKISRPASRDIYLRKKLITKLDIFRDTPVVWISAPGGYGKTTLVSNYIDIRKIPTLWYQMDSGDNDPSSFFHYLSLAARKAAPRKRTILPKLTAEFDQEFKGFSHRYFQQLFAKLPAASTLVFDNYQEVGEDSALHEILEAGLSQMPEGLRVIIISRSTPPQELSRMRANQFMRVINQDDMLLDLGEVKGIAAKKGLKGFTDETLLRLHNKSAGWLAGLLLILESAGDNDADFPSVEDLSQDIFFDYFANEVISKMDVETRDFMLMAAFLPNANIDMAKELTGNSRARSIFSTLNKKNYFIHRYMSTGKAYYQFHPLFREFLLNFFIDNCDMTHTNKVRVKAAIILETDGQTEAAAELYTAALEWNLLATLINNNAEGMINEGRSKPIEALLNTIPEEIIDKDPWLTYWQGLCRLPVNPSESLPIFVKVYELFKMKKDARAMVLTICGALDSILAEQRDFMITELWMERLREIRVANPEVFKEDDILERVTGCAFFALFQIWPDHREFFYWKKQAQTIINKTSNINNRLYIAGCLVVHYCWKGDLVEAGMIVEKINNISDIKKATPFPLARWISGKQFYYFSICDEKSLIEAHNEGLKLSKETGLTVWNAQLIGVMVCWATSEGKYSLAEKYLLEMEKVFKKLGYNNNVQTAIYYMVSGWLNLSKGNLIDSVSNFKSTIMYLIELNMISLKMLGHYGLALAYHELGDEKSADSNLEDSLTCGKRMEGKLIEFMCLLARAQFAFDRGVEKKGVGFLKKAMSLGREKNFINFLLWSSSKMANLCVQAFRYDIETEYVEQLVRKRGLIPKTPPTDVEDWPWAIKIYTLGRFEIIRDKAPITFKGGKAPKKPIEMLKVLLALGGRGVREVQISDILWPDSDGDAAHNAFAVTLKRLRNIIGVDEAIIMKDGRLSIDPRFCWVDYWALEKTLALFQAKVESGKEEDLNKIIKRSIGLYHGCFLGGDIAEPWSVFLCERLREKMVQALRIKAQHHEKNDNYVAASEYYSKGIEIDELAEEFYQKLMICYEKLGRKAEALREFERLTATLDAVMSTKPSGKSRKIYERLSSTV